MTKLCFNLFIFCTYSGRKRSGWTHRRLKDKIRVYSLNVMKPEASASISLKSLAMFMSDTPRAERSRAVNSSRVIRSSLSVSNSCRREDRPTPRSAFYLLSRTFLIWHGWGVGRKAYSEVDFRK